jgi:peptidoglycan/LPS O-acetylase OafA/YrhL
LWSLAVEEQFYLIWPFIVLFTHKKYILHSILILIFVGVISQWNCKNDFDALLLHTRIDLFSYGALLAWLFKQKADRLNFFYTRITVIVLIGLIIEIKLVIVSTFYIPVRVFYGICSLWLITHVVKRKEERKGPLTKLLSNNFLVSIGKISYGMYLYHLYIPHLRQFLLKPFLGNYNPGIDRPIMFLPFFIFDLLLLFSIALLSWKFIERPILAFKKNLVM